MNALSLAHYLAFCIHVRELCQTHHASVISWHRSRKRNRAVKGHPQSFHLDGLAADLVPDQPAALDALAADAKRRGLQCARKPLTLHVELDTRTAPGALTKPRAHSAHASPRGNESKPGALTKPRAHAAHAAPRS